MSTKHLTIGDPCPPLKAGKLRLYSMKFCPFADRTRLVLHAKNIPHEVVNINTWEKPEWFFVKNPRAQVPVLEQDGEIICESLITSEYLDELYPNRRPLYPKDLYAKARDRMALDLFSNKVHSQFWKTFRAKGTDVEAKEEFLAGLSQIDQELEKRGTDFFGGDQPGMVDYMMWPFIRRIRIHKTMSSEGDDLPADSLDTLKAWRTRMFEDPSVKSILLPEKAYVEFRAHYRTPTTKFDEIEC